jgi:hypothetical protein
MLFSQKKNLRKKRKVSPEERYLESESYYETEASQLSNNFVTGAKTILTTKMAEERKKKLHDEVQVSQKSNNLT